MNEGRDFLSIIDEFLDTLRKFSPLITIFSLFIVLGVFISELRKIYLSPWSLVFAGVWGMIGIFVYSIVVHTSITRSRLNRNRLAIFVFTFFTLITVLYLLLAFSWFFSPPEEHLAKLEESTREKFYNTLFEILIYRPFDPVFFILILIVSSLLALFYPWLFQNR